MPIEGLDSRWAGPLPLLQQVSSVMELVSVIDELVAWDPVRCRLSPGRRIEALVLDIVAGRALVGNLTVSRLHAGPWTISSPPPMTRRASEVSRLTGFDLDAVYRLPL